MEEFLLGDEKILYLEDEGVFQPIGCLSSNPLNEGLELISTYTRNSNGWKSAVPGAQFGSISFDAFQFTSFNSNKLGYEDLRIKKRFRVRVRWKISNLDGSLSDSGYGYITNLGESNQSGELLTFSGEIILDGPPDGFGSSTGPGGDPNTGNYIFQDGDNYVFQDGNNMIFN